jgi:biotin carboxyl carrier protein
MAAPPNSTAAKRYRTTVGNHSLDVTLQEGRLVVDGEPVTHAFVEVSEGFYSLLLGNRSYAVTVEEQAGVLCVTTGGRRLDVRVQDEKALLLDRFGLAEASDAGDLAVRAPMPGLVLNVLVEPGQQVTAGEGLVVLEAMKMENELRAAVDGVVKAVHIARGEAVGKNTLLIELED